MGLWRLSFLLALSVVVALSACDDKKSSKNRSKTKRRAEAARTQWKGVLMTGDDSIDAFDNARKKLKELWLERGIPETSIRELSMKKSEQRGRTKASSLKALDTAMKSLKFGKNDGCLIHLTSHGSPWGFYMRDQDALSPHDLDKLLVKHCGERPTVLLVSACYSGVFVRSPLQKPNRVILSAARDDRNSFGCGVEDEFTFWDGCVIEHLPTSDTWTTLYESVASCIRSKERETHLRFSYPQARFGARVKDLPIFGAAQEKVAE